MPPFMLYETKDIGICLHKVRSLVLSQIKIKQYISDQADDAADDYHDISDNRAVCGQC